MHAPRQGCECTARLLRLHIGQPAPCSKTSSLEAGWAYLAVSLRTAALSISRRERETQHRSPARHTQRSSSRKSERRRVPAYSAPAAVVSEVFVDETPKGLVLLRLARLDVKSKPDPNCED